MDVRHLELLRDLADRGTVTAVAAATHRTPSAVSQQLRSAERELGVTLVVPDGRRLRLTAAGRLLADGAADVALALANLQAELDALRDAPRGLVRLGALPSAAEVFVPQLYSRLRGTDVRIELDDFDVAEAEFDTRVMDHDIVIGHTLSTPRTDRQADLVRVVLAREPLDVALRVDHPLANRERLHPRDVAGEPWVGVPVGYPFDTILVAVEHATGTTAQRVQRVRDNHVVEALVAAGAGLAILPRYTTRPRDGVVTRPLVGVRAIRDIVALARRDRAAQQVVRTVLGELREIGRALG